MKVKELFSGTFLLSTTTYTLSSAEMLLKTFAEEVVFVQENIILLICFLRSNKDFMKQTICI